MNYTMVYLKWEACLVRGYMGYRDYNACGGSGGGREGHGGQGGGEEGSGDYKGHRIHEQPDDIV